MMREEEVLLTRTLFVYDDMRRVATSYWILRASLALTYIVI